MISDFVIFFIPLQNETVYFIFLPIIVCLLFAAKVGAHNLNFI